MEIERIVDLDCSKELIFNVDNGAYHSDEFDVHFILSAGGSESEELLLRIKFAPETSDTVRVEISELKKPVEPFAVGVVHTKIMNQLRPITKFITTWTWFNNNQYIQDVFEVDISFNSGKMTPGLIAAIIGTWVEYKKHNAEKYLDW